MLEQQRKEIMICMVEQNFFNIKDYMDAVREIEKIKDKFYDFSTIRILDIIIEEIIDSVIWGDEEEMIGETD